MNLISTYSDTKVLLLSAGLPDTDYRLALSLLLNRI